MCPLHHRYTSAFTECPECRDAALELPTVDGSGHYWPTRAAHIQAENMKLRDELRGASRRFSVMRTVAAMGWIAFVVTLITTGAYFS